MIRESREERKLKAFRRAEFRCKQRLEMIDWEFDVLNKEIDNFLDRASLPEPPSDLGFDMEYTPPQVKPRDKAKRKKA